MRVENKGGLYVFYTNLGAGSIQKWVIFEQIQYTILTCIYKFYGVMYALYIILFHFFCKCIYSLYHSIKITVLI